MAGIFQYVSFNDIINVRLVNKQFLKVCKEPLAISNLSIDSQHSLAMEYLLSKRYYLQELYIFCNTINILKKLFENGLKLDFNTNVFHQYDDKDLSIFTFIVNDLVTFDSLFHGVKYAKINYLMHIKQEQQVIFYNMMCTFIEYVGKSHISKIEIIIDIEIIEKSNDILMLLKLLKSKKCGKSDIKYTIQFPTKNTIKQRELTYSLQLFVDDIEQTHYYYGEEMYFYRLNLY